MQPEPLKDHREPHLQNLAYLLIYFPTIAAILIATLTRYPSQMLHDPFLPYYDTVTSALTISTIAVAALVVDHCCIDG